MTYLEAEVPVFALTTGKRRVVVESDDDVREYEPSAGYRTIAVVTDRRLLLLVGGGDADGSDLSRSCSLVDVVETDVEGGFRWRSLVLRTADGVTWRLPSDDRDVEAVAEYVAAAAGTWVHVENVADDVRRELVVATQQRNDGEYDTALETVRAAQRRVGGARERATDLAQEWAGRAVLDRVAAVERRCAETVIDVRTGRARWYIDEGERRWREERYESAHDAFERAIADYEAVVSSDPGIVESMDTVLAERDRVERLIGKLEESPLRKAMSADADARAADDPATAADHWLDAIEAYRTALELDWGADERRFAGDPDQIRKRLGTVAERLVAARRAQAVESLRAADWYVGAEQYDAAHEAFEDARRTFERAVETARDLYPDAVDHLETELSAVEDRLQRLTEREGDDAVRLADVAPDESAMYGPASKPEAAFGAGAAADTGAGIETEAGTGARAETEVETRSETGVETGAGTGAETGPSAGDGTRNDDSFESHHGTKNGSPQSVGGRNDESLEAAGGGEADPLASVGGGTDAIDVHEDDGGGEPARRSSDPASIAERLRALDDDAFVDVVAEVLAAKGWTVAAPAGTPYDLRATKTEPAQQTMAVVVVHRPGNEAVGAAVVETCGSVLRNDPDADAVMLVTSASVTSEATSLATHEDVRVFDDECLTTVIEARGIDVEPAPRQGVEE